jgi:threonine synthase
MRKDSSMPGSIDTTSTRPAATSSAGLLGPALGLACRECGAHYPLAPEHVCAECFGPLGVDYGTERWRGLGRAELAAGPPTLWRYAPLLPAPGDPALRVDLGAGYTRLVRADNLARALGMRSLWVKDDSANPTHSFKDRVVAMAASAARAFGFRVIACASTGNLAGAVAAAAAKSGLHAVVLVPAGLEAGKVVSTALYGATLVAVDGSYDDVNRLCAELAADEPWGFANINLRAFYAEGSKTVGYEIAEQLGWRLPEQVVVPMASGSLLTKVDAAFGELAGLGLVEARPYRMFGAQASGCAPIATAYREGRDVVQPVRPATIAKSLSIGDPADGGYALESVRRTGGAMSHVDDDTIVAGIRLLAASEGVFAETAGGVTVGCLRALLDDGLLDPAAETVLLNTGDGLKTLDALPERARPLPSVAPTVEAFRAAVHLPGTGPRLPDAAG